MTLTPSIIGPVTGGNGFPVLVTTSLDLASVGYEQRELFVSGSARSFTSPSALDPDGRWNVERADLAPYTTRIVVYRPIDPAELSGTVVVEWLNVSAGFDTAPDWLAAHNTMIRDRVVWIGVSAQAGGVQGGGPAVGGVAAGGLKAADPQRYERLRHPGDRYSYDIFSQVGMLARRPGITDAVHQVIGIGESQSAFRLVTYINAIHPIAHAYDGFLVHSRGGGAASLTDDPSDDTEVPEDAIIRTDLDVPVLVVQTESDLTLLDSVPARQPDTDLVRFWEVAGTAHADAYTAGIGFNDAGDGSAERQLLDVGAIDGGPLGCGAPINAGPAYAVLQAGLHGLIRWITGSDALPTGPRIELEQVDPVVIARDQHGNARGGIRTPLVDVPIATLRGDENVGESFCRLFGSTKPFDARQLGALYSTHAEYTAAFEQSANAAVAAGFLLPPEAENLQHAAATAAVPPVDGGST